MFMSDLPDVKAAIFALRPFVVLWMANFGHQPADCEDLAQRVTEEAADSADSYDPARAKVKTWVYGFAVRISANFKREAARRQDVLDTKLHGHLLASSYVPTPEEALISRNVHEFVMARLQGIQPKYLDILLACDMNGLSEEEAAEAFGIPIGTVKSRRSRARDQAFERLGKYRQELRAVIPALFVASEAQRNGWGIATTVTVATLAAACACAATWAIMRTPVLAVAEPAQPRILVTVTPGATCEPAPPLEVAPDCVCDKPTDVSHPRAMVEAIERAVARGDEKAARAAMERYLRIYPKDPIRARSMFGWLLVR